MSRYSTQDRVFLVECYIKCNDNATLALRMWSSAHKNRPKPSPSTLESLVIKFRETGSVADNHETRANRELPVRTPELIEETRKIVSKEPTLSIRNLARKIGVSSSTAWKICRKDLELFPYKSQMLQRLSEQSIAKRMAFASEMCQLIDEKKIDINKIIFTDEAHFWLDGYVNNQNYRFWGSEKPVVTNTTPLHPKKLTVWCGLTANHILGPVFIEETIDSKQYNYLLKQYIIPKAKELGMTGRYIYQQDGAPPHTTRENLALLNENFGSRVIARRYPDIYNKGLAWPPYSPDLSPLDFFLWGYTKDRVYKNRPKTINELKMAIIETLRNIPAAGLSRTIGSFEKRLRYVIHTEGGHIENIIQ